jgi:hypothetical protein
LVCLIDGKMSRNCEVFVLDFLREIPVEEEHSIFNCVADKTKSPNVEFGDSMEDLRDPFDDSEGEDGNIKTVIS